MCSLAAVKDKVAMLLIKVVLLPPKDLPTRRGPLLLGTLLHIARGAPGRRRCSPSGVIPAPTGSISPASRTWKKNMVVSPRGLGKGKVFGAKNARISICVCRKDPI